MSTKYVDLAMPSRMNERSEESFIISPKLESVIVVFKDEVTTEQIKKYADDIVAQGKRKPFFFLSFCNSQNQRYLTPFSLALLGGKITNPYYESGSDIVNVKAFKLKSLPPCTTKAKFH